MIEPIAVTKDRMKRLLAEWKLNNDHIWKMEDNQSDIVCSIKEAFGRVVTEEQLLAPLSWEVYSYHSAELKANYDDRVAEFLKLMEWSDFKFHDTETLQIDGHTLLIFTGDKELSIFFENGINELVAFCQKQGIKPNVETLYDQRDKAQKQVDRLTEIIESLKNTGI